MKKEIVINEIKNKIQENIDKLEDVPEFLIPKVNEPNDFAYPYIEISDERIFYIIIRERGVEYRRDLFINIHSLLKAIFEMVTKSLVIEKLKEGDLEINPLIIEQKQKEIMRLLDI